MGYRVGFQCFEFQHTAARRRLAVAVSCAFASSLFQHTAARRRLVTVMCCKKVKTCFNTQPPEGGWSRLILYSAPNACFNTQPPEGGWNKAVMFAIREEVSTHSRPKAAGYAGEDLPEIEKFQHTAARRRLERLSNARYQISRFNTQPPEGGCFRPARTWSFQVGFQHTAARRRLRPPCTALTSWKWFQHTAARSRLHKADD